MARFFLRFYVPIMLGVLVLALAIFTPQIVPTGPKVELEVGLLIGVLGVKVPLASWAENIWIIRLILAIVAISCVFFGLTANFAKYFPERLRMDVYFDRSGIARTLRAFSEDDLAGVDLSSNWEEEIARYDQEVVDGLNGLWKKRGKKDAPVLENFGREMIAAKGESTMVVLRRGLLHYKIIESAGYLQLHLDVRNKPSFRFRSEFYLRDSGRNLIRPKLMELLQTAQVVLRPEFKQVFQIEEGGSDAPFDHVVIAVTKVRLLPIPSFSDTIYLWKAPNSGYVPVAYAVYSGDDSLAESRSTSFS